MPKKMFEGLVVNNKADKTVSVLIERKTFHKKYQKTVRVSKKYLAHDENNDLNIGDKVRIIESIPISKQKKWRVCQVNKGVA